ncbi:MULTISPECIES: hypothetical protein [unclassified Caballeronia]|uniref:hypothetical protein n=1 Tax=unclassified Caballeronia TaxID=2646786 RepID=UPI002028F4D9|nr:MULTISPECIES: hypothetical protein [unclassified Caballeronia]MDR5770093.1 hypothetical protein [Caballeronia sp. LZ028]
MKACSKNSRCHAPYVRNLATVHIVFAAGHKVKIGLSIHKEDAKHVGSTQIEKTRYPLLSWGKLGRTPCRIKAQLERPHSISNPVVDRIEVTRRQLSAISSYAVEPEPRHMKGHPPRHIIGKRSTSYGAREDFRTAKPPARSDLHPVHTP